MSGNSSESEILAKDFYDAIQYHTNYSARSLQSKEFRVGVSDLGFCPERTRRMLDQQVPDDVDMMPAWIGTALGDHAEQAAMERWPNAVRQTTVSVTLTGETMAYTLTGHPDLILPEQGILIDVKTDFGLDDVRRTGPSLSQHFQRNLYAKGAHEAGLFGDMALADIRVANVWIDRSALQREVHVQMEPYDENYVTLAGQWLDNVVYAWQHNEEAEKVPPREMCAVVCGFYSVCRAYDTDVEGLITDPALTTAAEMYAEGTALSKRGWQLKEQAKAHLAGVSGSTGEYLIRWTHVNETDLAYTRKGYDKLDVKKIPERSKK